MTKLTLAVPGTATFEQILQGAISNLSDEQKRNAMYSVIKGEPNNSIVPEVAAGIQLLILAGKKEEVISMLQG